MSRKVRHPYPDLAVAELQGKRKIGRPEDQPGARKRPFGFWILKPRVKETLAFVEEKLAIYEARVADPNCPNKTVADARWAIFLIDTVLQRGEADAWALEDEFRKQFPSSAKLLSRQEMRDRANFIQKYCREGAATTGVAQGPDPRVRPYEGHFRW